MDSGENQPGADREKSLVIFDLARRLSGPVAEALEAQGITATADLIALLGTMLALAQSYAISNGSDLEETIAVGHRLVDKVTRSLAAGDQKFDA